LFFFFQAEDGIRDFHVTGVQTCALPIFGNRSRARATVREQALLMGLHGGLVYSLGIWPYVYGQSFDGQGDPAMIAQIIRDRVQRSEERRVGKECRSRRAPDSQYINEGKR